MATDSTTTPERRLLEAMAEAITEKGYAATTIADVVRHARVSKRTFYEHFPDKESAFLATYSAASDDMLQVIAEAIGGDAPWRERVTAGIRAYLAELAAHPTLTRTFLVEIQAAGPRGLALRRDVLRRFAGGLQAVVEDVRREDPGMPPLPAEVAVAAVGGINELLLGAVEEGAVADLPRLTGTAAEFLVAVFEGRRRAPGG
jgi:AcrR family transcriptional regulator